jgi:hypothetical protein
MKHVNLNKTTAMHTVGSANRFNYDDDHHHHHNRYFHYLMMMMMTHWQGSALSNWFPYLKPIPRALLTHCPDDGGSKHL